MVSHVVSLRHSWHLLMLMVTLGISLQPSPSVGADDLARRLRPLLDRHRGEVAVAIKHLSRDETYLHRADEPMPTASLIKFPIMVEAYRQSEAGIVSLDDELIVTQEDQVPGSGILTKHFSAGAKIKLRDAIRLMIAYSDNTATNLVVDRIGLAATAERMAELGMPNTKLHSKVFRRDTSIFPDRSQEFGLGSTTATETMRLYELLHEEELVSPAASREMLEHLLNCEDRSKLARDLPSGTQLAHKSGATSRVRTDAGLLWTTTGPVAICVLTRKNADRRYDDANDAHLLCGRVARAVYDYYASDPSEDPAADNTLRVGAFSRLVEDLQRTLNVRLKPSPGLAIDGDFGPATEAAVKRFQERNGLAVTGVVDDAMWTALGPLKASEQNVASPGEVNSEQLSVAEADPLQGRPYVTCKAWAIGDGKTGELLWEENAEQRLDIASTTKVMTAYVVLRLAEDDPGILQEELTFSERADRTTGSTSAVRAGERLTVNETLYGLLLPSGNDASVALAEHFGDRFSPASSEPTGDSPDTDREDPLNRFIAQMNREAARLGMVNTTYRNPHGLTAEHHQSTAADLLKLAYAAWQLDDFRRYVGTRQRGAELVGPGGYRRNIIWKNTNRLLAIAGYHGIKTGTTSAAGACLISTAARNGTRRFMVVLGSAASAARYTDTRNLYRWAWQQSESDEDD